MGALELRHKLIEQFNLLLHDDSKLLVLDGVFDAMNSTVKEPSVIPEAHYKIVEERRRKYLAGESKCYSWEEVQQKLKDKYDL